MSANSVSQIQNLLLSSRNHARMGICSSEASVGHLVTDEGRPPYLNKYRLSKKRGVRFMGHDKSPCQVFIMDCLFMLLWLVLDNPNEEFKGTDTTMRAAWEDKTKRKNGKKVIVGNEITTPTHKYIKLHVELTACNLLFNHFGPISNAGKILKDWVRPPVTPSSRNISATISRLSLILSTDGILAWRPRYSQRRGTPAQMTFIKFTPNSCH
jgi:hypothetical protein